MSDKRSGPPSPGGGGSPAERAGRGETCRPRGRRRGHPRQIRSPPVTRPRLPRSPAAARTGCGGSASTAPRPCGRAAQMPSGSSGAHSSASRSRARIFGGSFRLGRMSPISDARRLVSSLSSMAAIIAGTTWRRGIAIGRHGWSERGIASYVSGTPRFFRSRRSARYDLRGSAWRDSCRSPALHSSPPSTPSPRFPREASGRAAGAEGDEPGAG